MPKGNLKFKFLPEQEIQLFCETDLVTKTCPRGGVTVSFDKAGVCDNEFYGGLSLDIYTIRKIVPKGIYTPFNHNTHKRRNKVGA